MILAIVVIMKTKRKRAILPKSITKMPRYTMIKNMLQRKNMPKVQRKRAVAIAR
jgi:hypothetical protein